MLGLLIMRQFRCAKLALCTAILLSVSFGIAEIAAAQTSPLRPGSPEFRLERNTDPLSPGQYRQQLRQSVVGVPQRRPLGAAPAIGLNSLALVQGDPQIVELARGLQHDPDLIYEFVHDNIAFETSFGSAKGPIGTLLDRSGNAFDQASLMIALLRESGLTANYVNGTIVLDLAQVQDWIGPADSPINAAQVFANAGVPVGITANNNIAITHVWVRVTIDGTDYVFDPSFNAGNRSPAIDLAVVMGYDQTTFLTGALAGATQDPDFLQHVNRSNIRSSLDSYATNLSNHISGQMSGARLSDVIGGVTFESLPLGMQLRQIALPYQVSEDAVWLEIPDGQRATLRIRMPGLDQTLFSDATYHKRLTISYDTSIRPVLRLEGTTLATGFADVPGTNRIMDLDANVAFTGNSGFLGDLPFSPRIRAVSGATYAIMNGWGRTGRGLVEFHKRRLQENRDAGQADSAESVLGESLAVVANTWLAQRSQQLQLSARLGNINPVTSSTLGVAGDSGQGPYVDIATSSLSTSFVGSATDQVADFFGAGGGASALESAVIKQVFDVDAASTMSLFDLAVLQSQKIYEITSANVAQVRPLLLGYNAGTLNEFELRANAGQRVIAPERGDLTIEQWRGAAYLGIQGFEGGSVSGGVTYAIGGGLNGGFAVEPRSPQQIGEGASSRQPIDITTPHPDHFAADPVDLVTGHFIHENDDLTVGSAPQPIGLGFQRSYSSGQRLVDGPLGRGWTHNFAVQAKEDSDGFQALGEDSPVDAAANVVAFFVALDLFKGDKTIDRLVISSLIQKWAMDQMTNNAVTISQGSGTTQFIKLADGSYNPPPGSAASLTRPAGAFAMRAKDGTTIDFASDGKIQTWRNANGVTLNFAYSGDKLTSVSNGLGRTLTLAYSGTRIASVSDGTGRSVSFGYDADSNLTRFTDPGGHNTIFVYDLPGRMTQITLPSNPTVPFVTNNYDSLGRVQSQVSARGNVQGANSADFMTEFFVAGTRTAERNPLGDEQVLYFNVRGKLLRRVDSAGQVTSNDYDGADRLVLTTLPEGNSTALLYDAEHNPIAITRHPKPGSAEAPLVEHMTYEPDFGKVTSTINPLGRQTDFVIDPFNGNVLRIDPPAVDGVVASTTMTYNALGQVETVTDPEGTVTRNTYLPNGNLSSTVADEVSLNLTTLFGYNTVGDMTSITDARGHVTTSSYDARRLLVGMVAPPPFNFQTTLVYDDDGRVLQTQRETGDPVTPFQISKQSYDVAGNNAMATDPLGNVTSFSYDPLERIESILDGELRERLFTYDPVGRLLQTIDVVDGFGLVTSENSYTANGLPASLKDANGNITAFAYDGLERQVRSTFSDGSFKALTHDELGNVLSERTRAGDLITFSHDALNRLASKTVPAIGGPVTTTYDYDLAGRLLLTSDSVFTIDRSYDALGRLIEEIQSNRTVSFDYDEVGNVSKLTWPDLYAAEYSYDALNRMVDVSERSEPQATPTLLARYSHDALSRRARTDFGNGAASRFSYSLNNELQSLVHDMPGGGSDSFGYDYNNVGEQIAQDISHPGNLYRPVVADRSETTLNNLNQYTSVAAVVFNYDENGNLVGDGFNLYGYDAESRLVEVLTAAPVTVALAYDPLNRRVRKSVDGQVTQFLHSGLQEIAEYDSNGTLLRRFVPASMLDDIVVTIEASGARFFHHSDALGSTVARSNAAGSVTERHAFGPFAEESGQAIGSTFRFAGQRLDSETGLYYLRARYYSVALGRFLQTDPAGFVDGPNLYTYANNSPLAFIDPLGLRAARTTEPRNLLVQGIIAVSPGFLNDVQRFFDHPGREFVEMLNSAPPMLGIAQAPGAFIGAGNQLRAAVARALGRTDDLPVCRGGICTAQSFATGTGVTEDANGVLQGISTQSNPAVTAVEVLAQGVRNNQVGVTTVGKIRKAEGTVVFDGTPANPNHATVGGLTAEQAENLFSPTFTNPIPKSQRRN